ncbi:MAG: alpha-L-fucosidase [Planctomycetes bacterium]|nr:alpha-L-fucosidase [Planctomycetota bacterium]
MNQSSRRRPRSRSLLTSAALLAAACGSGPSPTPPATSAPAMPTQDQRMQWWREARFGMFIHWGLYAIPAGAWRGNTDYGEWIRDSARIPVDVYERFQPQWNPTAFDADAWARLAAAAGMKYLVITSKHHDGFCLFDSAQTTWDVGGTPNPRDLLGELAAACRRHGVVFCTYHSIMDWHHPDYLPRRPWEAATRPADGADFERFERYLHAQVGEVIERYRPGVMWFDGEWESTWNHDRGLRLFELCRRLAPTMLVNNRVDVHRGGMGGFSASSEAVGDFATPEQEIPATGLPGVDWESCMTMNDHWGWNAADPDWKSATTLLRNLVDIASKGGNYLLNIGPRADGSFPPQAVERLQRIAAWMRSNGDAIHGTTASVFDTLPFGRCTVRAGEAASTLYLHVFDWPATGRITLPGLANTVTRAFVLGDPANVLSVAATADGVGIRLPAQPADDIDTVIAVELLGRPVVYRAPVLTADAEQFVHANVVTMAAGEGLEVRYTLDGQQPLAGSPRADGPVRLTATTTVRAAAFHQARRVSEVVSRTFTRVEPLPPCKVLPAAAGLRREQFVVDWTSIPDQHDGGSAATSTVVTGIGFQQNPGEHVAQRYLGFVEVPQDELYRFALRSDDGSKLWIDGELVVDNDGLHGSTEKSGVIALAKGPHALELVWFNRTGGADLGLRWATPGQPFAPLPAAVLKH